MIMGGHKKGKDQSTKDTVIRCRVTNEFNQRLEEYCKRENVTKSEVIVKGVEKIINK